MLKKKQFPQNQDAQKLAFSKFYGKIIRNDYIILRRDRMSVSFENKETNHGVLTFTISQEQIKPALDRVFESVKKTLNVPGFRKVIFHVQSSTNVSVKKLFTKML